MEELRKFLIDNGILEEVIGQLRIPRRNYYSSKSMSHRSFFWRFNWYTPGKSYENIASAHKDWLRVCDQKGIKGSFSNRMKDREALIAQLQESPKAKLRKIIRKTYANTRTT